MSTKFLHKWVKRTIPGIITGGADNDPSGIATYSISGASFGFSQLWLMVLATPMLIAVQSMCSRLGNVQRKGLSTILSQQFRPWVSWVATVILIVSNVTTIGADILAVSEAFSLITHVAATIWILPVTIGIWYIVLFKNYRVLSRFLLLMVIFFFAYIVAAVAAHPHWPSVFSGMFIPHFSQYKASFYVAAVGILGTTITPYLFFWQVKEEIEEHKTKQEAEAQVQHEDIINAPGFVFSQIITIFIIIAAGSTLYASGATIESARDAAMALAPVAGQGATVLFAIGIIGAGLLALPVLSASTAYVVAESAGWKAESLSNKVNRAKGFYAVITLSLLAGVAMVLLNVNPIKALYYSQVLAGILAPFLLILLLIVCNRKAVLGSYRNGWFDNTFGTLAVIVMLGAVVFMFV